MNKSEVAALFNGINNCGNLAGKKFGYFLARNLNLLKPEVEKIEESRKALIDNYAKKVDGKLVIEGNNFVFDDKEAFEVEFKKLMLEGVEIKTFMIKLEEVPENITAGQLSGIYELIIEE